MDGMVMMMHHHHPQAAADRPGGFGWHRQRVVAIVPGAVAAVPNAACRQRITWAGVVVVAGVQ
jgi:hypothetical protein